MSEEMKLMNRPGEGIELAGKLTRKSCQNEIFEHLLVIKITGYSIHRENSPKKNQRTIENHWRLSQVIIEAYGAG